MDRFRVLSESGRYHVHDTMWGNVLGPYLTAGEAYEAIRSMREDGME